MGYDIGLLISQIHYGYTVALPVATSRETHAPIPICIHANSTGHQASACHCMSWCHWKLKECDPAPSEAR